MTRGPEDRIPIGIYQRAWRKVGVLAELVKFEHSVFALPYAYVGALFGAATAPRLVLETFPPQHAPATPYITLSGWPTWHAILWITVAMVGARSFAFVLNRAIDCEIDARNPRTARRALPAGRLGAGELWMFAAVVLFVFLLSVWMLHPVTRLLWPLVLLPFIIYPYMKRLTWLCHYWLGLCLGLAPVGAWTAVTGNPLDYRPYVFGLAVMLWTAGFDIIYATQDVEIDRVQGLRSVPADLGVARALTQTRWLHTLTVALLVAGGVAVGAGWPYYLGIAVAAGLLVHENRLVEPWDLTRVDAAFFTMNGIIAVVVFLGTLADRLVTTR